MKQVLRFTAFAVLGGLACCALAAADDKQVKAANDTDFLVKAAECGHAEVKFSELAEKRASSEKVKEFAKHMVRDHGEANNQLAEHSKNLKVAVLAGLDRDKRAIYDRLEKLSGEEFDRAYMKQMVEDHEKAVTLFESQAKSPGEGQLKRFAEQTLPTLREHLKKAREIAQEVKAN
jgi:putative membrane protein